VTSEGRSLSPEPTPSGERVSSSDTWIDRERPHWPREVHQAHLDADRDHLPEQGEDAGDGLFDNCYLCGLASTSDGKQHGFDA